MDFRPLVRLLPPLALVLALSAAAASGAHAQSADSQNARVAVVSLQRILQEAAPAVAAQKKLEAEFAKRNQDLRTAGERVQRMQEELQRNAATMSESDRASRERELNEAGRDFQRMQVQFREDLQQRRNEELSSVIESADKAVKQIADREKFDIILQEAIFYSPRVDITDRVIKMLNEGRGAAR